MANSRLIELQKDYQSIEKDFNSFNKTLYETISKHNQLSLSLRKLWGNVSHITTLYLNETYAQIGEEIVASTNQIINSLNNSSIISQESKIAEVENRTNAFLGLNRDNSSEKRKMNISLKEYSPQIVSFNFSVLEQTTSIKEPESQCCLFNRCDSCCDDSCFNDSEKYPIVFVHGHAFSSSISPEYNLNSFEEMQRAIEDGGYLNSGSLILGSLETQGALGRTRSPISLKVSYYFDSIQTADRINTLYTKQDNIDTYAIRLREIIEAVKLATKREKVVLVTHSMGGLVARRYLQIFGNEDSVYKMILIAAPNHGINKELYDSCTLFGSDVECEDMYEESLLISKLNAQKGVGKTKIYNIIGIGCDTYGENGDGIVKNSSAFLSFANNYYLNGSCGGSFDYFHNKIINPLKTSETKELVLRILNEE